MSAAEDVRSGADATWSTLAIWTRTLGRAAFGDRTGLVVWLGLALALATLWRIGFFITDTYTVANTLVNVADGHLAITRIEYSLTMGTQPGLHQYGGSLYGRNYGQVVFALPVLWLLEAVAALATPRVAILGGWSLGLIAGSYHLGVLVEERGPIPVVGGRFPGSRNDGGRRGDGRFTVGRSTITVAGSAVAVAVLLLGITVGTPLPADRLPLAALQLSTILAAATVGLIVYRLLALLGGRRVAVAAGVAAGLATPVGFWASLPKRHVLVSALLLAAVYCFARSRTDESRRFRAGAYAFAGLVAWIHAFEGFFFVVALGSVDLATARSNGWRDLAIVALALLLALSPTFATNAAISGNPLQPPRLLPGVGVGGVELAPGGDLAATGPSEGIRTGGGGDLLGPSGGDSTTGGGDGGTEGPVGLLVGFLAWALGGLLGLLPRPPDSVRVILGFVVSTVTEGIAALADPGRLYHVFVRSGNVPGVDHAVTQFETIELTVLESMPLLGALAAVPVLAAVRLREAGRRVARWPRVLRWSRSLSPAGQTDLLVAVVAVVVTVIYLSRLPLYSMLTVRYLLPIYPLGLYGVARLGPVAGTVEDRPGTLARAYLVAVVVGFPALWGVLTVVDPALGEAVQLHALGNLGLAAVLAAVVVARALRPARVSSRTVAVVIGVTAAATTLYLVLAALAYFPYDAYALEGSRLVADALASLV